MSDKAIEGGASPTRLSTTVMERILTAIQDRSLVDERGRLPAERKLAEMFDTSRTTVREALQHLRSEGVLQFGNRARARVRTDALSADFYRQLAAAARVLMDQHGGIEEFQEARALFECGLVRHAARHATPKQLGRLTQAFLENQQALGQLQPFIDTDMQFHRVLAEIPGNPIFVVIHTALSDWLAEQRRLGLTVQNSDELAFRGHQEILDAIGARDPQAAEKAMAKHLLNVSAHYIRAKVLRQSTGLSS